MTLVYRTDQTTPLTNKQVDDNFKFLKEEIDDKYNISDFTAAKISLKLNTPATGQTTSGLAESNALNAWLVRGLEPLPGVPVSANKSSLVARDANGQISVTTITGTLIGNASTATMSAGATKLETARNINGVLFDGTSDITVADDTKLPKSGGTLTGKLNLSAAVSSQASVNIGVGASPDEIAKVNGDLWATSAGVFYYISGQTNQVATLASPTFTGVPQAPGFAGGSDQIITLSHLNNAVSTLNTSISTKSNVASPTFTGVPQAPTAASNNNSTQIATTAFVTSKLNTQETAITSAYQQYTTNAVVTYSNTVNQLLALKANLASPEFTGTPRSTTPTTGDNSSRIATTAFTTASVSTLQSTVNSAIAALQDLINSTRPVPAGAVFYMASTTVPYGYLECNGDWVLKDSYVDLWQALGSPALGTGANAGKFKLPDLRGEFVRGWDHDRGIDRNFNNTGSREIRSWQIGSLHLHNDEADAYTGGIWNNMWNDGSGYTHANDSVQPYGNGHANQLGYDAMTFEWLGAYANTTRLPWNSNNPLFGSNIYEWKSGGSGGISLQPGTTYRSNHWIFMARPRNVALMPIIKW